MNKKYLGAKTKDEIPCHIVYLKSTYMYKLDSISSNSVNDMNQFLTSILLGRYNLLF